MAPVTQGVHVTQVKTVLKAKGDTGDSAGDLAGDEGFTAQRGFVVKEDTVAGVDAVGFAIVDGDPVAVEFGDGIGGAGIEGSRLLLGGLLHQTVKLARGCLIEASLFFKSQDADGFKDAQRADAVGIGGILRGLEGDRHM